MAIPPATGPATPAPEQRFVEQTVMPNQRDIAEPVHQARRIGESGTGGRERRTAQTDSIPNELTRVPTDRWDIGGRPAADEQMTDEKDRVGWRGKRRGPLPYRERRKWLDLDGCGSLNSGTGVPQQRR